MDDLRNVSSSWDSMAQANAMEAILTGSEWEESEFYASGENEVDEILERVRSQATDLKTQNALDFGCGLGRLSFGLCRHFENVTGIDISQEMIRRAASSPRKPKNLQLTHTDKKDLRFFDDRSLDFILSLIVLQHIPRRIVKNYIEEFLRIARPGGIIVFQAVTRPTGLRKSTKQEFWKDKPLNWDSPPIPKLIYRATARLIRWIPRKVLTHRVSCYLKKITGKPIMQMNPISARSVEKTVNGRGGKILCMAEDGRAGPDFESMLFIVRKN